MAKFNIYRIRSGEQDNLLERFQKAKLEKQHSETIAGYELTFYFSKTPDEVPIWWVKFYEKFIPSSQRGITNKIYYAALMAQKGSSIYVVSLGKSHFYVKDYCDQDFGLNLAERIANEKDVKIKNTKFFKNKRNKVITSYHNNSSIDFESGESMHFLKARSIESEKWGKTVNFGQSVLFVLDADHTRIPKLLEDIEAELKKAPRINLPKVTPVTDESKIKELDKRLVDAIESGDDSSSVEESQFTLQGVDFVFSDEHEYSFFIAGNHRDKSEPGPLSMERLRDFLQKRSLTVQSSLNTLKITVHKEHGRDHSENFKNFLEFIDERDKICLIDGRWYIFNQSYLNFLKQEIDSVPCDIAYHNEPLPSEDVFLESRKAHGYTVIHTELTTRDDKYSIEAGDMVKEDTLYIVKKGHPKQLNYAIDQAIASINYLQENDGVVEIDGKKYSIKNIRLLLLLDRKTPLQHLFELNSLIFHMKLIDWHRLTRSARFYPSVQIEQYTG